MFLVCPPLEAEKDSHPIFNAFLLIITILEKLVTKGGELRFTEISEMDRVNLDFCCLNNSG